MQSATAARPLFRSAAGRTGTLAGKHCAHCPDAMWGLCGDEYPVGMGRAGGLREILQTIGEADNYVCLAGALLQRVGPVLQPRRVRRAMQDILIQCRDKVAGAQRSVIL